MIKTEKKQADWQARLPFCLGSLEWGTDKQSLQLVTGWMALGSQMFEKLSNNSQTLQQLERKTRSSYDPAFQTACTRLEKRTPKQDERGKF